MNLIKYLFIISLSILFGLFTTNFFLEKKYNLGNPIKYYYHPLYGYGVQKNQKNYRVANKYITIDKYGMRRNIQEEWEDKNKRKIIFFGDSVTYGGSYIDDKKIFSELTCKALNSFKTEKNICGNFGTNAYGIENIYERAWFINKTLKPEILIIIFSSGNLKRGKSHLHSQPFYSKNIKSMFPALSEVFHILLNDYLFKKRYHYNEPGVEYNLKLKNYYRDNLEKIKNLNKNTDSKLYIFFHPSKNDFIKDSQNNDENLIRNFIKDYFKSKTNNFYDMKDIINNNGISYKEIYYDNIHLNEKGHKIYANIISSVLK